jgi:ribosomal protein S18 acetylase RimI-like enzyme
VHAGSLGLTDEGDGEARLRWFVLDPDLRGQGLGRRLLEEFLAEAKRFGHRRIVLETFSDLRAAAHLYRGHGFELVWAETKPRWGRADFTYQRYELDLAADKVRLPWRRSVQMTSSSSAPPASPAA